MRRTLPALVALLLVLGGAAYFFRTRAPRPALTVTPSPIDFGEVPWLETRAVKVVLRNDSAHEVFLRKLSYDCSCFSASQPVDATSLAPGREARLEVRLVTDSRVTPGRFRKTFTVETSDPVAPRIEVPMIGNITDFRSVTPREVTLGAVEAGGAPVTRTIEVRGGEGSTVAVVEAVTSDPRLETEIRPATDGTDVLVRTRKDAAKGRVSAQVRMTLEVSRSDGRMKRYPDSVWVNGEVR